MSIKRSDEYYVPQAFPDIRTRGHLKKLNPGAVDLFTGMAGKEIHPIR